MDARASGDDCAPAFGEGRGLLQALWDVEEVFMEGGRRPSRFQPFSELGDLIRSGLAYVTGSVSQVGLFGAGGWGLASEFERLEEDGVVGTGGAVGPAGAGTTPRRAAPRPLRSVGASSRASPHARLQRSPRRIGRRRRTAYLPLTRRTVRCSLRARASPWALYTDARRRSLTPPAARYAMKGGAAPGRLS